MRIRRDGVGEMDEDEWRCGWRSKSRDGGEGVGLVVDGDGRGRLVLSAG